MNTVPALDLRAVGKAFGALRVLDAVDLTVHPGEIVAVLGPSGSGKSTLLHIAGLMERPSEGTVTVGGVDTGMLSDARRARLRLDSIGFVFQFHHLLPDFNLLENTLMPCRLAKDASSSAEARARDLLDRVGLTARLSHRPAELSGGEQQRGAIARALVRSPGLLLCDEPTGNLDPHTASEVFSLLQDELRRGGVAAVVVTHNMDIAARATRVLRLVDGRLAPVARV